MTRKLAGAGLIALAGFLTLRGGINAAVPIFIMGLGLLGQHSIFPHGFSWPRKKSGQKSRVMTSLLSMELDHDTGSMVGEVLSGPLRGRNLSTLSNQELQSLHLVSSATDDRSGMLLEAWLDRFKPDWRQWVSSGEKSSGTESREEAYAILGLKKGASADEIHAAHRRLMKQFHPDRGGSDYFAAKINRAKDILLQR